MKRPFHIKVRFMGGFRGIKTGFADKFTVYHYLRAPFSLVGANPKQSNFISFGSFSNVLKVTKSRYLTKIAKTIVLFISVYVVDVLRRPVSGVVGPRQSVRELLSIVNGDSPVSRRLFSARPLTDKIRSIFVAFPRKDTRVRIVGQRGPQMLYGAGRVVCHDNAFTIGAAA